MVIIVYYTGLARVAREAGLTVRETSGWKTRTAHRGGMRAARGVLWHHTATSASAVRARNNPTLNYMINGLGYPLANYGLAWDGSIDVIAAGTGAHAGKGSYSGIPRDQGNYYLIGIEVEGTTGLAWSNAQLEAAAKLGAQLDKEFGGLKHIGHYEYAPRRKVDPTGIPGNMNALRRAINRGYWSTSTATATATTPKPPAQPKGQLSVSDINKILEAIGERATRNQVNAVYVRQREYQNEMLSEIGKRATRNMVNSVYVRQREYQAELEEMIHQLAEATGVTIDYDKVREAAKKGAKEALEEGIDIEAEAEVTFHNESEDQNDEGE